jgi:hypothetical protein
MSAAGIQKQQDRGGSPTDEAAKKDFAMSPEAQAEGFHAPRSLDQSIPAHNAM